jgi:hypothetical protein
VKAKESDKDDSKWFQFSDNASVIMKLQGSHARPREEMHNSVRRDGTFSRSGTSESILFSDTSSK